MATLVGERNVKQMVMVTLKAMKKQPSVRKFLMKVVIMSVFQKKYLNKNATMSKCLRLPKFLKKNATIFRYQRKPKFQSKNATLLMCPELPKFLRKNATI